MSLLSWLRQLVGGGSQKAGGTPRRRSRWDRYRLQLEGLEGRLAPTINVAVVDTGGQGDDSGYMAIQSQLNDSTAFSFNATLVQASQLETVAAYQPFNAVVIGGNGNLTGNPFDDTKFTSALETWTLAGGGVVLTGLGIRAADNSAGKANIQAIVPVDMSGGYNQLFTTATVTINGTSHPVTAGVPNFTIPGDGLEFSPGGINVNLSATLLGTVQFQGNPQPVVVVANAGSGRSVYLGPFYSGPSSGTTDLRSGSPDQLLEQAVNWVASVPANQPPVAKAGGPYAIDNGNSLTLDASQSSDPNPGGSITKYEWDVNNDGTYDFTTTSPTLFETYAQLTAAGLKTGSNTVGLRVTDNLGLTGTTTTTVTVNATTSPTVNLPTAGGAFRLYANGTNAELDQGSTVLFQLPDSGLTGLKVQGASGNDTLTVDYTGGIPVPSGGLTYDGGAGTNTLAVKGTFQTATETFTTTGPGHSGAVQLDDGTHPVTTVTYQNLAPVDLTGATAGNLVFNLPAGTQAVLEAVAGMPGFNDIRGLGGPAFGTTTFASPGTSLTVTAAGSSLVQLAAMDGGFAPTTEKLGGQASDTFQLTAANAIPGASALTLTTATLDLNGKGDSLGGLGGTGTITSAAGSASLTVTNGGAFSGNIQSAVGLTVGGSGKTLTLSGTNSYSGPTTINPGDTLKAGSTSALSAGSDVNDNGTLDLAGFSNSIGALGGGGLVNSSTAATLTVTHGGTFTGGLQGALALTLAGGTLDLTGTSTATGPTTVAAGTLLVDGSLASAVAVASGATLGGNGSTGAVTVAGGGTLSPGVLNTGTLALGNSGNFNEAVGGKGAGDYSQVNVAGTVSLNGATLNLASFGGYVPQPGDEYLLIRNDGTDPVNGTFAGLPEGAALGNFLGSGLTAYLTYKGGDGNDVAVTVTGSFTYTSAGGDLTLRLDSAGANPNLELLAGSMVVDSRPFKSVAAVTINGSASQNDSLTVDFGNGNPIPAGGLGYHGNGPNTTPPGDLLKVNGGPGFGTLAYSATGAGAGSLVFDATSTILFDGLGAATVTPVAGTVTINIDPGNTINGLVNTTFTGGSGSNAVSFDNGLVGLTFADPSTALNVNGHATADNITFTSLDSGFQAAVTLTGGSGSDTVNVNTPLELAGALNIDGTTETTNLDASITAPSISIRSGTTVVGGAVTVDTSATNGPITFGGTVTDAAADTDSLTLMAGEGSVTMSGAVGGTPLLGFAISGATTASLQAVSVGVDGISVVTSGATGATLNGGLTSGGPISLTGNLTLASSVMLTHTGAKSLSISGGTLNLGSSTLSDAQGTAASTGTIASQITGMGGLMESGPGTLTLANAANSYSGGTTVTGGILTVNSDGDLGAVPGSPTTNVTLNGGILQFGAAISLNANRGIALGSAGGTVDTNGFNVTLGSALTDMAGQTGSLIKAGTGSLTVTGTANSYGGATVIEAGTLRAGTANALPAGTALTVNAIFDLAGFNQQVAALAGGGTATDSGGAATFTVSPSGPDTFGGTLTGSGLSLTVTGTSPLTLNSANAYGGSTTVSSGATLQLGAANALPAGSDVVVNGTLTQNGQSDTIASLTVNRGGLFSGSAGTISVGNVTVTAGGTLAAPSGTLNIAGNFTDAGIFNANGGTVNLTGTGQAISGSTTFNNLAKAVLAADTLTFAAGSAQTIAGALTLRGAAGGLLALRSSAPGARWALNPQGGRTVAFVDAQDGTNANAAALPAASSHDSGDNTNWLFAETSLTWTGLVSSSWGAPGNWDLGYVPNATDDATIPATANEPVLDAARTVHNLTIQAGATLTLAGQDFTAAGAFINQGTLVLQGNETVNISQDTTEGTWRYVGDNTGADYAIKDFGAADYFNLQIRDLSAHPDTFQLGSALVVGGAFTLSGGSFSAAGQAVNVTGLTTVDGSSYAAGAGTQTLAGGLAVRGGSFTGAGGTVTTSGVSLSGGRLTAPSAAGEFDVSGNWSATGGSFVANGGTISFTAPGGTQTLNAGGFPFNNLSHTGAGTLQLATSDLVAGGSLTEAGTAGPIDLNGRAAQVASLAGTGTITNTSAIGASTLTVDYATPGTSDVFGGTLADASGTGGQFLALVKAGAGTLDLSGGTSTYAGGSTFNAGTIKVSAAANLGTGPTTINGATLEVNGTFSIAQAFTLGDPAATIQVDGDNALTLGTAVGGRGSLSKTGLGTLTLAATGTYAGSTTVSDGTLAAGTADALSAGTALTVNGTLDLAGFSNSVGTLGGNGLVTSGAAATLTVTQGGTFSGSLQGGLALTLVGGTLDLTGTSTATGPTTVSAGTLLVNGAIASAVAVAGGGTLGGSGSTGTVTVAGGGILSPGVLNTGSLTLGSGANFNEAVGGNGVGHYGQVDVSGTINLGGATLNLASFGGYVPQPGDEYLLIRNDGTDPVSGTFAGLPEGAALGNFLGSGLTAYLTYKGGDGNDVAITVAGPFTYNSAGGDLTLKLDSPGVNPNLELLAGPMVVDSRPFISVTAVIVNGSSTQNDSLTVDFGNGSPVPAGSLTYHGNGPNTALPGDVLKVTGGPGFGTLTYNATGAGAGNLVFDASTTAFFDGLGAVTVAPAAGTTTLSISDGQSHNATFTAAGAGMNTVMIDGGLESLTFANPTNQLNVNADPGSDTFTFSSLDAEFSAAVAVHGSTGGADTVNLNTALTLNGPLTVDSAVETTNLNAAVIATSVTVQSATTTIGANVTLDTSAANGPITIGHSVNDAGATPTNTLTLKAGAGIIALPTVGGTRSLAGFSSITTTTGSTVLNGSVNAGSITLSGNVTLATSLALTHTGANSLSVGGGTIGLGANTLTDAPSTGASTGSITSQITGTGGLIESGPGALTLGNAANGYGGGTTVAGGTVSVSADGDLGSVPASPTTNVTLNGGALQFGTAFNPNANRTIALGSAGGTIDTNGFNVTLGSALTDMAGQTGSLIKVGTGSLAVTGTANSYGGATAIRAGTLRLGAANALPAGTALTVNDTFDLAGFNLQVAALTGGGTATDSGGAATLTVSPSGPDTFGGILTGNGLSLTVAGTGPLTLNSANNYGGSTTVSGGASLQLGATNALPADTSVVVNGTLAQNGQSDAIGSLTVNGGGLFSGSAGTISVGNVTVNAAGTLTAPSGTLNIAGNFDDAGTFEANGGTVNLTGTGQAISGSTTFNNLAKAVTAADTLTFAAGSAQTIAGALTLRGAAGGLLALRSSAPGARWALNPQGGRTVAFVDAQDGTNANAAALPAASSHDSGDNTNWLFAETSLTWTGLVSSSWGAPGNWDLGYVPNATDDATIPATANEPVLDPARTVHNLTIQAGATLTLAGQDFTATGTFTNQGTFVLQGNETTNLTQDAAEGTWRYVGDNTGASYVIKDFGAADYFDLQIRDLNAHPDTFRLGSALAVGGAFILSGGNFSAAGQAANVTGLTTVAGGSYAAGAGTQTLAGGLAVNGGSFTGDGSTVATGSVTLSSGSLTAPSAVGAFNVSGNWSVSGGSFVASDGTVTFTAAGGTQTLSSGGFPFNNISHTGAGTLQLVTSDLAAGGSLTEPGTAGPIDLNGRAAQVASLAGTGTIANASTTSASTLTVDYTPTGTADLFGGTLADASGTGGQPLALVKAGAGTLVLTGASTATGPIAVNAGTLLVDNATGSGTGSGSVTVNNTGTVLGGTGSIAGTITVNSGAFINPGDPGLVGTLTVGGLSFDGGTYADDFNGNSSDQIVTAGAINLNAGSPGVFAVNSQAGTTSLGTVFTLIRNTAAGPISNPPLAGAPEGGSATINGQTATYSYAGGPGGNGFTLTVSPTGPAVVSGSGNLELRRIISGSEDDIQLLQDGTVIDVRPTASVTSYTVNGGAADDTLNINYTASGGFFAFPVTFNGGSGFNTLDITGGSFTTDTYNYTNASDGNIHLDGTVISYTGLSPLVNTGTVLNEVFNLPAGFLAGQTFNDAFLEESGTAGTPLQLRSSNGTFGVTQFTSPGGSLTINVGTAGDRLASSALTDLTAALTAGTTTSPFAQDNVSGPLNLNHGSLSLNATGIYLGGNITTSGGQTYNGAVSLGASSTLTAGDTVSFSGNVSSASSGASGLTVSAGTAAVHFGGVVGTPASPLQSLSVTTSGTITLGGNVNTDSSSGTGDVTFTGGGNVVLGTSLILRTNQSDSANGGAVDFGTSSVSAGAADVDFTVNTLSVGHSAGDVSNLTANDAGGFELRNLTVNGKTISANAIAATGNIALTGQAAVVLRGAVTGANVNLTAGTDITEQGAGLVSTTGTLTTNSGTGTALNGANLVSSFHATNTASGDIDLTNGAGPLIITGISEVGGAVTLTTSGLLTIGTGAGEGIAAAGGTVDLNAVGITETATPSPSIITAGSLRLRGTGIFTLGTSNAVPTMAAAVNGALVFNDGGTALDVGSVLGTNGINSTNNDVTLCTASAGGLSISQVLNAGSGTVRLQPGGGISQGAAGGITAANLGVVAAAPVTLNGAPNTVPGTFAASVSGGGSVTFIDAVGFNTDTVTAVGPCFPNPVTGVATTANGNISLTAATGSLTVGDPSGMASTNITAGGSGTVSLTTNSSAGDIVINGVVQSGSGTVAATSGRNIFFGQTLSAGGQVQTGGKVSLVSTNPAGTVSQLAPGTSVVAAGNLSITAGAGIGSPSRSFFLSAGMLQTNSSADNGPQFLGATSPTQLNVPSALNAATGTLTLTGGTFQVTANALGNAINDSSPVVVASPAVLDLHNNNETVFSLAGGGGVALGGGTLRTGNNNGDSPVFNGVISGSSGVIKTGTDTWTLTGLNTFTGPTNVTGGTLTLGAGGALNANAVAAAGVVNLSNPGVALNGAGTINGQVTVSASDNGNAGADNTRVDGVTITVQPGSTGLTVVTGATFAQVGGNTGVTINGGGPTSIGLLFQPGASAVIAHSTITGQNIGVLVNGGTALLRGDHLGNDNVGSYATGLEARNGAIVDAGQLAGPGPSYGNFTGLGVSGGGNTFLGYTLDTSGTAGGSPTLLPGSGVPQAIRDLNTGGVYGNAGPQLGVYDLLAQNNTFGTTGGPVGSPSQVEQLIFHDLDNSALGFVRYDTPSVSPPSVVGNVLYAASFSPTLTAAQQGVGTLKAGADLVKGDPNFLNGQKSVIRYIEVTFSSYVFLDPNNNSPTGNFGLKLVKVNGPYGAPANTLIQAHVYSATSNPSNGQYIVIYSFSGPGTEGGALEDGNYSLQFNEGAIQAGGPGGPALSPAGDPFAAAAAQFFRLYGDSTGDRVVNNINTNAFQAAYRSRVGTSNYRAYFDFDGDGLVDAVDYYQFLRRRGNNTNGGYLDGNGNFIVLS